MIYYKTVNQCLLLQNRYGATETSDAIAEKNSKPIKTPCYMFTLAWLSAIGNFLDGYNTAVVTGATLSVTEEFSLTTYQKELFVSITSEYVRMEM